MPKYGTVDVQRKLNHEGETYLIVTRPHGMHEDEVATFSGPNAETRAAAYVAKVYQAEARQAITT
jgi:hypothetical protein